jgi:hypothetical protein
MSANLIANVAHPSSPCSCGGAATSVAAGCTCGGAGCGMCQSQGFMRPRFFAGQLLTEEDLQELGNYVVAKNRLHNRFLFGEGVVCGLEVTCHPCGGGQVIVYPGYALDCCGNDLTLACAQTLDINAMVRELRRTMLGFDCGDPCAEKTETVKPANLAQGEAQAKQEDIARHYCLYIRYCEEMTDPVAPYSTGEPCGAQVCEPTRVREGLRFELRCREAGKPHSGLLARLCQCLGDLDSAEKSVRDIQYFQVFARQTQRAVEAIKDDPVPPFEPLQVEELGQTTTRLNGQTEEIGGLEQPRRARPRRASEAQTLTDEKLRDVLDAVLETASLVARFYSRGQDEQLRLLADEGFGESLRNALNLAKEALTRVQETLTAERITNTLTLALERESALGLIEVSRKLTGGQPPADDPEVRFLAEHAVFTPRVLAAAAISLDALREWLLDRLDKSPHLTDCTLRQAVRYVIPPTPPAAEGSPGRLGLSDATVFTKAAESLANVFFRYLTDCLCAALNPACAPCDDPAVLLACLEVKDCEVVRICNLERTFVLSPTAVRYWLPIGLFGQLIEQACCGVAGYPDIQTASFIGRKASALFGTIQEKPLSSTATSPLRVLIPLLSAVLSEVCGKDEERLRRMVFSAATLFQRQSDKDLPAGGTHPSRVFSLLNTSTMET